MKTKPKSKRTPARLVDRDGNVYYVGLNIMEYMLGVTDTSISRVLREDPCPNKSLLIRIYNAFPNMLNGKQKALARKLIRQGYVIKISAKKGVTA